MRRWLALCVLLIAAPTWASDPVLVIEPVWTSAFVADAVGAGEVVADQRMFQIVHQLLDLTGANYRWVKSTQTATEFCRLGVQTWNPGTAGAYTETVSGVIHLGFRSSTATSVYLAGYRPDSLTLTAGKPPLVPQLMLCGQQTQAGDVATAPYDNARDTSGTTQAAAVWTRVGAGLESEWMTMSLAGTSIRWLHQSGNPGVLLNATQPAGGSRRIVSGRLSGLARYTFNTGTNCVWCDSSAVFSSVDTTWIWDRMMSHKTGIKPIIFAQPMFTDLCGDSMANAVPCGFDLPTMLLALAHFDSLVGGQLWPASTSKLPIKMGLTIDGGFCRNAVGHYRGIAPDDTTSLYTAIDSLASLNMPAVLGVNLDSVSVYARDKTMWAKWPRLRYSPQNWAAVGDTTKNTGNASWLRPLDPWGRYRSRVAYGGTSCNTGGAADTATNCLLASSFWHTDSIFPGQLSRFVMPPDDDWTSLKWRTVTEDSIAYAASVAGVVGIRINGQSRVSDPTYLRTNPRGAYPSQRTLLSGISGSRPISLLAHSGFPVVGGRSHYDVALDSVAPYADGWTNPLIANELTRAWGMLLPYHQDYEIFVGDFWTQHNEKYVASADGIYNVHHGSVIRLSAMDFSGGRNTPPTLLGWWVVKSINNVMLAANQLANRNVIVWAYPEDIRP